MWTSHESVSRYWLDYWPFLSVHNGAQVQARGASMYMGAGALKHGISMPRAPPRERAPVDVAMTPWGVPGRSPGNDMVKGKLFRRATAAMAVVQPAHCIAC